MLHQIDRETPKMRMRIEKWSRGELYKYLELSGVGVPSM